MLPIFVARHYYWCPVVTAGGGGGGGGRPILPEGCYFQ